MDLNSSASDCPWLIAVHGGAGHHSTDPLSEKSVKHALRSACTAAVEVLRRKDKSLDSVERAVCALEDDACLNAGYGSNLTMDGTVECDASIMDGAAHDFGSAGAVQGIKNPISLARAILVNSRRPQPLGRVSPLTLVGPGARAFAASAGIQLVGSDALFSERSRNEWQKWKARFEDASSAGPDSVTIGSSTVTCGLEHEDHSILDDTVGAVACDTSGGLSAGVSSGGLLLKYPGRIGEAAIFGAGVWAHSPPDEQRGIACSVSGTGEAVVRTSFAHTLVEALFVASPEDTHQVIQSKLKAFIDEIGARGEEPNVGVLVVTKELVEDENNGVSSDSDFEVEAEAEEKMNLLSTSEKPGSSPAPQQRRTRKRSPPVETTPSKTTAKVRLRLWCAFTTESMAIAYTSSEDSKPRALIMRHQTYRTHRDTNVKRGVCIAALPLSR
ncbi:hypothetical protein ACEPAI_7925 [Sanghuangporus weigelae]